MDLHKIGVKVFAAEETQVPLTEYIPVFHRWIQEKRLEDLLIDVADYSHVPEGPGVLLVAHEGNYSVDESDGRRGLAYYSKQPLPGTAALRLAGVCRKALEACRMLEEEAGAARTRFDGHRLEIFANDRLQAPNTVETLNRLRPDIEALTASLYSGAQCAFEREQDKDERFSVTVTCNDGASVEEMLNRLSA